MQFKKLCLKQNIVPFIHGNIVSFYISCKVNILSRDLTTGFRLRNCLFGAVKLTKNNDRDKYGDSGFSIGFDVLLQILWSDSSWGKMLLILELIIVLLCMFTIKKEIFFSEVFGEGQTQGLDDTKITAEAKYPINFTNHEKGLC